MVDKCIESVLEKVDIPSFEDGYRHCLLRFPLTGGNKTEIECPDEAFRNLVTMRNVLMYSVSHRMQSYFDDLHCSTLQLYISLIESGQIQS